MNSIEKSLMGLCLVIVAFALYLRWQPTPGPDDETQRRAALDTVANTLDRRLRAMECKATWYSSPEHGRPTASGEIFDSTALTCAIYRPFLRHAGGWGARLLVRNSYNGRAVVVRVTDAMPSRYAREGRMLDLSRAAAESLGMISDGIVPVEVWKAE